MPRLSRVLVTLNSDGEDLRHGVRERHLRMLVDAGLLPVLVPGTLGADAVVELAEGCSCAYLPGTDYVPERLGESDAESRAGALAAGIPWDAAKVRADLAVVALAWERRLPLLGVCGGMQAMVLHAGGTLRAADAAEAEVHGRVAQPHELAVAAGTLSSATFGERAAVNSYHRQVVAAVPEPLVVTARDADGVIEAVEAPPSIHPFWLGVQWHPELLGDARPYAALAAAAER